MYLGHKLASLLGVLALCAASSAFAQNKDAGAAAPVAASTVNAIEQDEAGKSGEKEAVEVIAPDTSRAILIQFKAANPGAKEHVLNLDSEAYVEDSSNPAVKLSRAWVGSGNVLLEIKGMSRSGQAFSAVLAPDTLKIKTLASTGPTIGAASSLLGYDGVTQVKDRRGGTVLQLRPGDTMYLLFGPLDDYYPFALTYLGWDGRPASYFDRIDPRFRERYDALYQRATAPEATPQQMKDFLVDFAKNDPDKRALKVFLALIEKMRTQNSFEGYYHAYLLLQDPADAKAAFKLSRTDEHRAMMEDIAVNTLADKSRLLDLSVSVKPSQVSSGTNDCSSGMFGFLKSMFCDHNSSANMAVSGVVTVAAKRTGTPIRLKQGTYKVHLETELFVPRWGRQASAVVGSFDKAADQFERGNITLTLSPPNYTATANINFGNASIAYFNRGSVGGYTAYWATGNGRASVKFKSMELVK